MQDSGRYDAASKLDMYLRKFTSYLGKDEIPFKDFDALLVRNYHTWLQHQELGRNTVSLYLRNLKRVYRMAVDEGITWDSLPFQGVDVSYRAKRDRNKLSPKEVVMLHYLDTSGLHSSTIFARDIFLFAVFTHGMTGGDIFHLTLENIKDGHLAYTAKTTGKRETVRWTSVLQGIVDRYARPGTPFLFPVITADSPEGQWHQHCVAIHNINRNLKKVGQLINLPFPLTMTVARYSWKELAKGVDIGDLL